MIRAVKSKDAQDIAALWNWMIRETLATFTCVEKTEQDIMALIEERQAFFVVADFGAGLAGFATCGPFRPGSGYAATCEHTVIVSPTAQGSGIGRTLLTTLEDKAKERDFHVMIGAVSSANPAATAFHKAMGYSETGRMPQVGRKKGQWLDLVLMQKVLTPDA